MMTNLKIVATFAFLLFPILASAQRAPAPAPARHVAPGNPGGGGPGGAVFTGGAGGAAQHRPEMLQAIQEQLGLSGDEWKLLKPKIDKVLDAKQKTSTGAGMSWSSRNGGKPVIQPNASPDTPAGKAMQEVKEIAAKKETPKEDIAKKLGTMRAARAKAKADLEAAQKDLQKDLTPWQEVVLVTLGVLE